MFDIYIRYHVNFYNLHVLHLSYVIYVHIYLSIDKTEVSTEKTEPVLLQMSKGKIVLWQIVFWDIYFCEIFWNSLCSWVTCKYWHT